MSLYRIDDGVVWQSVGRSSNVYLQICCSLALYRELQVIWRKLTESLRGPRQVLQPCC